MIGTSAAQTVRLDDAGQGAIGAFCCPGGTAPRSTLANGAGTEGGTVMSSASFKISLDAIGDGVVGTGLSSGSYHMDGGFGSAYPPPGEVPGLWFFDKQSLFWDPEKSVGTYNLYRDLMSNLAGLGYGICRQQNIENEAYADGDDPPDGDGYFYLVTAENRLGEEGTKGFAGTGAERPNSSPCP